MTTSNKQAPKNATRSAEELVQDIAKLEPDAMAAHRAFQAAVKAVDDFRDAHPELADLERAADEAYVQLGEKVVPIQGLLSALSQVDPSRFAQEMRRLHDAGLGEPE